MSNILKGLATDGSSGLINYYNTDDTTLSACTFSGNNGGAAGTAAAISITRVGRVVTLDIPVISCTPASASTVLVCNTAAPVWARPSGNKTGFITVMNNSAYVTTVLGLIQISSAGIIQIFRDVGSTAFTNAAAGGFRCILTYTV